MQIKFPQSIIKRVNENWLTKENADWFTECKTDSDKVCAFVGLSNATGYETMLAGTIYTIAWELVSENDKSVNS